MENIYPSFHFDFCFWQYKKRKLHIFLKYFFYRHIGTKQIIPATRSEFVKKVRGGKRNTFFSSLSLSYSFFSRLCLNLGLNTNCSGVRSDSCFIKEIFSYFLVVFKNCSVAKHFLVAKWNREVGKLNRRTFSRIHFFGNK